MNSVESARLFVRQPDLLQTGNAKAFLLEMGEDRAHLSGRNGVGFQNRESPFGQAISYQNKL
jgi:hypothetical protein